LKPASGHVHHDWKGGLNQLQLKNEIRLFYYPVIHKVRIWPATRSVVPLGETQETTAKPMVYHQGIRQKRG